MLDGNNLVTISGNNAVRILRKEPAANQAGGTLLVLQNLRLTNGRLVQRADDADLGGAAIASRGAFGALHVFNVVFDNNRTVFPDGAINSATSISANADACGAVHTVLYREAVFANCVFTNNRGANGGAVGGIGTGMTFINCRFEGNEATGTGGTFDKGGQGGAVYVDGTYQNGINNRLSLCGCQFKNNGAGHQGGAFNVVQYAGKGGSGSIDKCSFDKNRCNKTLGGGVYYQDGDLRITASSFTENYAGQQGGGIWYNNGNFTLTNCTLHANQAGDNATGLGGGVALTGGNVRNATISNCTFAENRAGNFASAVFNGADLSLLNNLFYKNPVGNGAQSNPYGGAVINKNSNLTVGGGNLQFPAGFTGQYGAQATDYWLTAAVLTQDANLQPPADNGGPTPTMALPAGSPAVGKGTAAGAPPTDQRGRNRRNPPDIGAYESN